MEEKLQRVLSAILTGFIIGLTACQKKEQEPQIIVDDANSEFAGKSCYGKALENQYLLSWSNGSVSVFKGSRQELEDKIKLENKDAPAVLLAEQDRALSLKNLELHPISYSPFSQSQGLFWQVWGQEDMAVSQLWDKNFKGSGVIVAVIDAGVDLSHPSLATRIALNDGEVPDNGIDDDNNGLIDDYAGFDFAYKEPKARSSSHGTHVAGIIGADPKKSPMSGVAPEAKILPLNIMDDQGGGSLSAAVLAIKYAGDRGVRIINASWGGAVCAESLKEMILRIKDKQILFVAAAGNDGVDIDVFPEFPAGFGLENQITVGASMPSGLMAAFSNYSRNRVHLLAPGDQILSSVPGGWKPASGTSMAAPFVSGLAALLWSAHPEATLLQVKEALLGSVQKPQTYTPVLAQGRINAPLALEKLEKAMQSPGQSQNLQGPEGE